MSSNTSSSNPWSGHLSRPVGVKLPDKPKYLIQLRSCRQRLVVRTFRELGAGIDGTENIDADALREDFGVYIDSVLFLLDHCNIYSIDILKLVAIEMEETYESLVKKKDGICCSPDEPILRIEGVYKLCYMIHFYTVYALNLIDGFISKIEPPESTQDVWDEVIFHARNYILELDQEIENHWQQMMLLLLEYQGVWTYFEMMATIQSNPKSEIGNRLYATPISVFEKIFAHRANHSMGLALVDDKEFASKGMSAKRTAGKTDHFAPEVRQFLLSQKDEDFSCAFVYLALIGWSEEDFGERPFSPELFYVPSRHRARLS